MRTLVLVPLLLVAPAALRAQERDSSAFVTAHARASSDAAAKKRAAERRRRRVDYLPATTIDYNAARLVEKRATGWNVLTSGDRQTTYLIIRRTVSSEPEVHARWDDIVIVRSGAGAIEMGDSLVGSRLRAPGERAGGALARKTQLIVRAGDVVRIPAAVPHAFIVSGAEPLEYLLIKQRRQELPIRWYGAR